MFKDIGNYLVYSDGRVLSNRKRKVFLKAWDDGNGYMAIKINDKSTKLHKVVADAFLGCCPDGFTVNHIDGDKTNNNIDNLEYISRIENYKHALKSGLKRNIQNYLTADEASDMVEFYHNTGYTMKEICSWFNFDRVVLNSLIQDNHKLLYK